MVVRSYAAPPTPWSRKLAEPTIHSTAYVHTSANIIGDVRIGANVMIAPSTSIRADEGSPFHLGEGTNIQDGVVIHGLEQGRVVGDDNQAYSVWVGDNSSITHMALVHGPAYVGNNCFIGFRSTIFNARVGDGCIVMMHTLIQDVEIPAGRYVPSGSIITTQQQADRLPEVKDSDVKFASHVLHINDALRSGYHCAEDVACIAPIRNEQDKTKEVNGFAMPNYSSRLNPETLDQVRRLLNQGYRIGTEHADERRFQTSSWKSCAPIQAHRESDVLAELETCLNEHTGEYVRLIGIDTKVKRRVLESIIQRPSDKPGQSSSSRQYSNPSRPTQSFSNSPNGQTSGSGLTSDVVSHVRSLLSQGYRIGMEHADERRFQTSSWKSCTPIQSNRESDVIHGLEACLNEHTGEYVRLIGIDTKVKRRVSEAIIQRPPGKGQGAKPQELPPARSNASYASSNGSSYGGQGSYGGQSQSTSIDPKIVDQVRQLLGQGAQIGTEYADERRFKIGSWQSGGAIQARRESDVVAALESTLREHGNDYVRLIGIDSKAKKRVLEVIIHRPSKKAANR